MVKTKKDILMGRGVQKKEKRWQEEIWRRQKIMAGPGLYANIHAKRKRGGKMRKKVQRVNFRRAAQTARKK